MKSIPATMAKCTVYLSEEVGEKAAGAAYFQVSIRPHESASVIEIVNTCHSCDNIWIKTATLQGSIHHERAPDGRDT